MDGDRLKKRLEGCYITVPTMFKDSDLLSDLEATRRSVRDDTGLTKKMERCSPAARRAIFPP